MLLAVALVTEAARVTEVHPAVKPTFVVFYEVTIMDTQSLKQEAIEAIVDSANSDDIMYQLYVIDKVRMGQQAAMRNELSTVAKFEKEIDSW